ncbi:MAG: protein O-mannosyl-transferase [Verrucomicrobiota bacterium]|jgi:tetratricopeptide (TPR) repeat protein
MSRRSTPRTVRRSSPVSYNRWAVLGVCVFLAAITWLVFGQTLRHDFVNVDDVDYVLKNLEVTRGLTSDGAIWAFTHFHASNWHPVTWISHMLDCQFYGLSPGGHHLTNVLLHTATAILLFLVLRQMTASLWRSAFVAAVFAIHPSRVESVAWVAERKDVLSGLFFVLTIGAYARYARHPSAAGYALVAVLFAVGLMCKPMLVTLPLVLLLLDYWPLNRWGEHGKHDVPQIPRRLLLEKLPLFGLAAASCLATLFAQKGAIQPFARISFPFRVFNAFISYAVYLRELFWPSDLAALYPFPVGGIAVAGMLSLGLVAGISIVVFALRRYPYLVTGWLWYLIMLGPVIGIIQVGIQAHADRYAYLPQIGLYLLLTWAVADLCAKWRYRRLILSTLSIILLAALTFVARTQASYWQNSQTLWTHAIACTSDNAMAHTNLGHAFYEKRMMGEALVHYRNALQIDPNQALAHSALGLALLETGRPDESVSHLLRALEINPNFADAHYNLGNTFMQIGQANEAVTHFRRALEINPDDIEALNNMAWMLATWPEAGIRDGNKAVELAERANSFTHGENPVVSASLAASYAEAGRPADAVRTAQHALQLATAQGSAARADSIRAQIELYRSGAAFRDRRYTRATR